VKGKLISGPIVVNALSGITGAGRTAKVNTLYGERTENANAYAPGTLHRHQAEIAERLGCAVSAGTSPAASSAPDAPATDAFSVLFTPHLVPVKQGMAATTVVPVSDTGSAVEAIRDRYANEPFVELTGTRPPETREVRGTNRIRIGWREERDTLILMSVIDNLWKGASGQAVQNMNTRFGFDETTGLAGFGDL
jgi:N-acetyl-gamma-glutamyl-phosphate reductase